MERLKKAFPEGVDYRIVYDPTIFVRESIDAVVETLFEAILLVVIVVMVFLQTWRASIIPLVAVPVSLVGTFAVMLRLGFSLNTLSLFGLVLAIGIVVDDAIVVVENVERHIELGQSPIEATRRGDGGSVGPDHRDRAGAVRGVRADGVHQRADRPVLPAVRADDRDLDRHLGVQLADAEPGAGVAAAAAARRAAGSAAARHRPRCSAGSSGCFNRFFTSRVGVLRQRRGAGAARRGRRARRLRRPDRPDGRSASRACRTGFVRRRTRTTSSRSRSCPTRATLDRTEAVIRQMSAIALEHPGVANSVAFPGLSINGFVNAPNAGIAFVTLKPSEERQERRTRQPAAIVQDLNQQLRRNPGSVRRDLPAAAGAGPRHGRRLQAVRRGSRRPGLRGAVRAGAGSARRRAQQTPSLAGLFSSFQVSVPQIDATSIASA